MSTPIARFLRQRRLDLELSQRALAKKIGVFPNRVHYWENGLVEPSLFNATCWAKALGVTLVPLLGEREGW